MPQLITESSTAFTATPVEGTKTDFLIDLITPGWGSSGYYSAKVLEQAAKDGVFSAGIHMHLDHQSLEDQIAQPAGSLKDFAAFLREEAIWNGEAIQAPVRAFSPYAPLLNEMKDVIGVSIRASAEVSQGEAEGRRGQIIDKLVEINTVDFVTHAGRGGKIVAVLESALGDTLTSAVAMARLKEARNIGQWMESRLHLELTRIADDMFGDGRLTREERISLSSAIGQALTTFASQLEDEQPQLYTRDLWEEPTAFLAATEHLRHLTEATSNDKGSALVALLRAEHGTDENVWVWLRDFDDTTAWFDIESGDDAGTWQQTYTTGEDDLPNALTDERTAVRSVTTYVPVDPAGQSTTQESKEDTMATTQIEESALAELNEKAGRVTALESERDTEKARADKAEADLAEVKAASQRAVDADGVISTVALEHGITFDGLQVAGLKASLPVKEGALDTETFTTTVKTHAAKLAEANGAGSMFGFGGGAPAGEDGFTEAQLHEALGITTGKEA